MLSINLNSIAYEKAWGNVGDITEKIHMSIRKISSGNNQYASEDPQNIPFIERLRSAIAELPERINQTRDEINMLQSQVSELQIKSDALSRIRELAVAYNNDTLSDSERENIQTEVDELSEIVSGDSSYSKRSNSDEHETIIIGSTVDKSQTPAFETIEVSQINVAGTIGASDDVSFVPSTESFLSLREVKEGFNLTYEEGPMFDLSSENILGSIDQKIESVSGAMASTGAKINALEYDIEKMENDNINMNEAYARYTETDLVRETSELMKNQTIRNFASQIIKAHSNLEKDNILALIDQF